MIATKYNAKNLLDHTVILKINTVSTSIFKGRSEIVEFIDGKDKVLFPAGSLEITPLVETEAEKSEVEKSESVPKVTEKKETAAQARARKAKEAKEAKTSKAPRAPKTAGVKIETDDK